ncbi:MAG: hypothetical protein M0D57_21885 [Sphingobacteriales bacterium JAD_PAG50586_3]|nr:MAG: hypothetical protein M0D57_21885 [Sphingobacteriales bacterium JAD_PAG50586_3]
MKKDKKAPAKSKKAKEDKNTSMPNSAGQLPQVKSDKENERQEGRRVASRNEPSQRKTEAKKPSQK